MKTMSLDKEDIHSISIRQADAGDAELLYSVCRQSYIESFADHWEEGGLEWYLDKVYGMDELQRDLKAPGLIYFISYYDSRPVGFMKVKLNSPLTQAMSGKHLEIEKLYFLAHYQRKGLGKVMISAVKKLAAQLDIKVVWLAVIDRNDKAISFYERNGFKFFDKTRLEIPYFKEELRGMWRMVLMDNQKI